MPYNFCLEFQCEQRSFSSLHGHPSLSHNFMVFKWPFPGPLVSQSRTRILVLILLVFLILWFCDLWSFLMCIFWETIWLRVLYSFPSKYLLLKPSLHFWPWHMPKVLMFCFDLWLDPIKMWPWLKWLHGKRHIRMFRSHFTPLLSDRIQWFSFPSLLFYRSCCWCFSHISAIIILKHNEIFVLVCVPPEADFAKIWMEVFF